MSSMFRRLTMAPTPEIVYATNKIKELYEKLNKETKISVLAFESELGVSAGTIKNIRNGRNFASADCIIKVANYFNVSVDYLLGRELKTEECPFNIQSTVLGDADIKTTPHFVAFIDVLGTQNMVKSNDKTLLQNMVEITHLAYDLVGKGKEFANQTLGTKIFSDNVVIFTPINKDNYTVGLQTLCMFVGFFQYLLLKYYKLYVRGGITIGEFFANEKFIYGQALNDAYNIEEKLAIYPRVVLSSQLIEQISIRNLTNEFYGIDKCLTYCHFDGCNYVNYLSFRTSEEIKEILTIVDNNISDLYSKTKNAAKFPYPHVLNINDEKIMQKYKQVQNFLQNSHTYKGIQEINAKANNNTSSSILINGNNSPIIDSRIEQNNFQYDNTFAELLSIWNKLSESKKEKLLIIAKELL